MKKVICRFCLDVHKKGEYHKCPKIFLHQYNELWMGNEIIVRGKNITCKWDKYGRVIIYHKKEQGK